MSPGEIRNYVNEAAWKIILRDSLLRSQKLVI